MFNPLVLHAKVCIIWFLTNTIIVPTLKKGFCLLSMFTFRRICTDRSQVEGVDRGLFPRMFHSEACTVLLCLLKQLLFIGFGKGWIVELKPNPFTGRQGNLQKSDKPLGLQTILYCCGSCSNSWRMLALPEYCTMIFKEMHWFSKYIFSPLFEKMFLGKYFSWNVIKWLEWKATHKVRN